MKKLLTVTVTVLMMLGCISLGAFADEGSDIVYVTLSDGDGKLVLAQEPVEVTDADGDGALTVNDALYLAHESKYEGGADAGYSSYMGDYGLALEKLWGEENGGSYGYYVNNTSAMSLVDPVADGDFVNAYVYTDLETWSDTYCFFDQYTVSADGEVSLTLSAAGYDADWNPVTLPVEGAVITVNGEAAEVRTDADGKFTVQLGAGETYIISATSDEMTLVPPVCTVTVADEETETDVPETEVTETAETESAGNESAETDPAETETAASVTDTVGTDAPVTDVTESNSPQTGDTAVAIAFVLAIAVCVAVLSARKKSYEK